MEYLKTLNKTIANNGILADRNKESRNKLKTAPNKYSIREKTTIASIDKHPFFCMCTNNV